MLVCLYVCMYMRMCVCTYSRMYVCMYAFIMYASSYLYLYLFIFLSILVCVIYHVSTYQHVCMQLLCHVRVCLVGLCLDAKWHGNIARFFNHSCDPNLCIQIAFVDTQDVRVPKVSKGGGGVKILLV